VSGGINFVGSVPGVSGLVRYFPRDGLEPSAQSRLCLSSVTSRFVAADPSLSLSSLSLLSLRRLPILEISPTDQSSSAELPCSYPKLYPPTFPPLSISLIARIINLVGPMHHCLREGTLIYNCQNHHLSVILLN
jgi:hypothetical protein